MQGAKKRRVNLALGFSRQFSEASMSSVKNHPEVERSEMREFLKESYAPDMYFLY